MFSDPVSFTGDTRVEVIAVLANCGRDTDRARRALVTWIRHKQDKNRSTEHILTKLRDIELKFIKDTTLHSVFRDARAETCLPRPPDLPPPSSIKRNSSEQTYQPISSVVTSHNTGRDSTSSSSLTEHVTRQTSSPNFALRLSRDSSQIAQISHRPSVPQSRSPRIQIPRDQPLQPAFNSPVTSSPEESEIHSRLRSMSQPTGPTFRSYGLVTPVTASPPEFPPPPTSFSDQNFSPRRRMSHGLVSPPASARIPIPRPQSQRSVPSPRSPSTPSSDESEYHPRRHRHRSQPVGPASPGRRRVTPPRTYPPEVPLPPIPSDDQGVDSDSAKPKKNLLEQPPPPTPVQTLTLQSTTPVRPLPVQPIPSPVPGADESELTDSFDGSSLRQNWQDSSGDLPADIVIRQDSPVYMFHEDRVSSAGVGPSRPYADRFDSYFPPAMPTISDSLSRAVNAARGSSEVQLVVSKCIECYRGYEPPYWQTHLQACGLDAETARHLVGEMWKQVDWAALFRRTT